MKAAVCTRYGLPEVVALCDVPTPVPGAGEVLVQVRAATVTRTDRETLRGHPWFARAVTGLVRPKTSILGVDFAGIVTEVGDRATRFRPGDRVFGLSPERFGCHAEYLAIAENAAIAEIPDGIAFHEAVVGEGAWYAHSNLEAFGLSEGQSVLVYGASGAIGTAAVQLAKARGATVTAVVATRHLDLAAALGADRVVDYTAEDFTARPERYDLVFDAVGKTSYRACKPLLKPGGAFHATDLGRWWENVFLSLWSSVTRSGRVAIGMPVRPEAVVGMIAELLADGRLRAVIDRHHPLDEIVEAYRHVATEQKTGIVVIDVAG
jgi:NADPH:quinone reductase-like Zn-dependent oxidoreductase